MSDLPMVVWGLAIDPAAGKVLYAATNDKGSGEAATQVRRGIRSAIPHTTFWIMVDPITHTLYASTSGACGTAPMESELAADKSVAPIGLHHSIGRVVTCTQGSTGIALSVNLGASWTDPDRARRQQGSGTRSRSIRTLAKPVGHHPGIHILTSQNRGKKWRAFGEGYWATRREDQYRSDELESSLPGLLHRWRLVQERRWRSDMGAACS
jgi:hypothetical protein